MLHISTTDKTMEGWVGRKREDSTEIAKKSISSHVARMTGGRNQTLVLKVLLKFYNTINVSAVTLKFE